MLTKKRPFSDTNVGNDTVVRFVPSEDARTVEVRVDDGASHTMRRVDLTRLHVWLGELLA